MSTLRHIVQWTRTTFPNPSAAAWVALAVVLAVDLIWSIWAGFHVSASSIKNLSFAALAMIILVGLALYGRNRDDLRTVVVWASATLFVIPFSIACVVLSYLAATINLPLVDASLAAFDRALGFNWMGLLEFVNVHSYFGHLTNAIYYAAFPELALLILFLAATRKSNEMNELIDIYWSTLLLAIVFSALFPALDPVGFYSPSLDGLQTVRATAGTVHLPDYLALRSGTYDTFDFGAMQGIISFPSFHAALALMMIWAVRHLPWLLAFSLFFNGLMLLATLTEGGHYLADVAAGSLLLIAAVSVRRFILNRDRGRVGGQSIASPARV